MDTDARDDDAPTVSAYPRQTPDVDEFGRAVEDCDGPDTWDEVPWAPDECVYRWSREGPDCADGLENPPCCRHCGRELHGTDDCDDIPF